MFSTIALETSRILTIEPLFQVVMSRREELFEVECDNAMVHTFLAKFPQNIDLEQIISRAHELYMTYPPEILQNRAECWLDEKYVSAPNFDEQSCAGM